MKKHCLQSLMIAYLTLVLTGCGFQLRGSAAIAQQYKQLYVQGINMQQGVGRQLKLGLRNNGVEVLKNYKQGSAVLTILDNRFERRVLSVGNNAQVSEYELLGQVTFELTDTEGKMVIESEQVMAQRDYQFDPNQVLSTDEEETQLIEQINQQLAQSIIRYLSAR